MITIDGVTYRTLEEQVKWLTENHTSGTYSGTEWQTLTVNGVTKNLPSGGGSDKAITDIIIDKPSADEVSLSDGVILVETSATVQYDDGSEENISFSYYIPIAAGTNISFTKNAAGTAIVISASGGTTTHPLIFNDGLEDIAEFDGSVERKLIAGDGMDFTVSEEDDNVTISPYCDDSTIEVNSNGRIAVKGNMVRGVTKNGTSVVGASGVADISYPIEILGASDV